MSETPDPIEEAVAQAMYKAEWKEEEFPSLGTRERWIRKASVAIVAHLATLEAAGFVIVPAEPTEAILVAAGFNQPGSEPYLCALEDYRSMIAAAQLKQKGPPA